MFQLKNGPITKCFDSDIFYIMIENEISMTSNNIKNHYDLKKKKKKSRYTVITVKFVCETFVNTSRNISSRWQKVL